MIMIDGFALNIDERVIKNHQRITGDTDELSVSIYKGMIEDETGLCFSDAVSSYSADALARIVSERIEIELSVFGG